MRLQQYVNRELPDVQTGFRKGRGTRDQIASIRWIIKKARKFRKNIYFCFMGYTKAFDCVDHNKLSKILQEMGIPDYLTCLLRNLYAVQEAIVRTWNNKLVPNWESSMSRQYIVTLLIQLICNIMPNARLDEAHAGIEIAGRDINILRYADDTTLVAEREEELKSLLMKVKEESEKPNLKLNIKKIRSWHLVPSLHGK